MKKWVLTYCFLLMGLKFLYAQQSIVESSSTVFQYYLFDNKFHGKIQIVSRYTYAGYKGIGIDTNYFSTQKGVFYNSDTAISNLSLVLWGTIFNYNFSSKKYLSKSGKTINIFDTSYSDKKDSVFDNTLFYPNENLFIHKVKKVSADTVSFLYWLRLFNKDKQIERIEYFTGRYNDISYDSIYSYFRKVKFSQVYKFSYFKIKGANKIKSINYYRTNKTTGKKYLYASNEYFYNEKGLVKKNIFKEFSSAGIEKVKGEILFKYW